MAGLDIPFRVLTRDTPEDFPPQLNGQEVALMLLNAKARLSMMRIYPKIIS
jgi:hypothetical protein